MQRPFLRNLTMNLVTSRFDGLRFSRMVFASGARTCHHEFCGAGEQ